MGKVWWDRGQVGWGGVGLGRNGWVRVGYGG